ncbi:hypothetical protein NQ317_017373 [Molorchus minor]|uniref:Tyr recombinase domain-containing protein n=1 Tax=Molorchus minor TaxID=1323400 RepID=A0ABQ9JSF2_9CUCU|nr:hypothetical protein NQ317_017373 [Molorchus minor]
MLLFVQIRLPVDCFLSIKIKDVLSNLIAKYLKLPNFDTDTGHCSRRTSATLLANAGGEICSLKRHGGWKS